MKKKWKTGNNSYRFRKAVRVVEPPVKWIKIKKQGPHQKQKLKGKAREGELYEDKVFEKISVLFPESNVYHGYWIHFEDELKKSWCSPDIFLIEDNILWIFESKLTYTKRAWDQLKLYSDLLNLAFKPELTICITVAKNLDSSREGYIPPTIKSPFDALERTDEKLIWYWRPR